MNPILLTQAAAREYLSGADPEQLVAPIRLGKRKWYSREALGWSIETARFVRRHYIDDESIFQGRIAKFTTKQEQK